MRLWLGTSITVGLAGCRGEGAEAARCGTQPHYAVVDSSWEFLEAVDYWDDEPFLATTQPALDWYSEHHRVVVQEPGRSESLRVSGHLEGLDDHRRRLVGGVLERRTIGGRDAVVGTGSQGAPAIAAFELCEGYTVMVLSYDLDVEGAVTVAEQLDVVATEVWVDQGGHIFDCSIFEEGCIEPRP